MSNAKSRYYEAVDASEQDPEMIGHIHTIYRGTPKIDWFDGEEWNGHPEKWLRPLPSDAVVISGEDIREIAAMVRNLRAPLQAADREILVDECLSILAILNRSQQNEEK